LKTAYVIGAGPLGLSAACELNRRNYKVVVVDSNNQIGGLAQSFDFNGDIVDLFYHFYYWGDELAATNFLADLIDDVNVLWQDISSENYVNGSFVNFDSLKSLLKLAGYDSHRLIWTLLKIKYLPISKKLDRVSANEWAKNSFGNNFFNNVWRPLLENKFGKHAALVSAYWLATRIKRHMSTKVGSAGRCRFGYLTSTYQPYFEVLKKKIIQNGGRFEMGQKIKKIVVENGTVKSLITEIRLIEIDDGAPVFCTIPLASLRDIEGISSSLSYLSSFNLVGAVVVILKIKKTLSGSYWTTVSDSTIPFDVLIQQNRLYSNAEFEIVYLSRYYDQSDSIFNEDEQAIKNLFLTGLLSMYPEINASDIHESVVVRTKNAAPVPLVGMLDKLPAYKSQFSNFYHGGFEHIYPEDRGVGNSFAIGKNMIETFLAKIDN
jgi:protoporphyrinogen oxidase